MITVTKIFTRLSEDTDFYSNSNFNEYLKSNYVDKGKIQVSTKVNPLTREVKMVMSEGVFAEFNADPAVQMYGTARDAHNLANNIQVTSNQEVA